MSQFNESCRLMMDWMMEVERTLDTHKEIAVSHEEIKQQLTEQKVRSLSWMCRPDLHVTFADPLLYN